MSKGTKRSRIATALAALALGLTGVAATAAAETVPTRTEYVSGAEAICRPRALATERAMKGVKADIGAERLSVAAAKFTKGGRLFGETVKLLEAQPRPPADAAKLGKWLGYLDQQESYLTQITAKLRARQTIKAQRLTARFIHNGNLANNTVLAFGFNYCDFKFSRYG